MMGRVEGVPDTVIELAHNELGLEIIERSIDRAELYTADECFLTGTAAEVIPVVKVDSRPIGDGKPDLVYTVVQNAGAGFKKPSSTVVIQQLP